ncbi:fibronectin type III domain-containing protein [Candidatus Gottesmanbacteria bacterium]|nr:fibronectin type III domain-containing protein [Candidatus Gottesmanbacteria bacterium]
MKLPLPSLHIGNVSFEKFKKYSRLAILLGILAVVIVATVFGGKMAAGMFARASTCPAKNVQAVQVGPNSTVISWASDENSQGRVEYGVDEANLTFSTLEGSAGKEHNVPLTLLTPNTVYYYQLVFGKSSSGGTSEIRCDSSGGICTKNCIAWTFTTSVAKPLKIDSLPTAIPTAIPTTVPTITKAITIPSVTIGPTVATSPTSTGGLSPFCQKVQENVGASSQNSATWPSVSQYDVDGNGIINGLDVIKCQQLGK